MSDSEVRRDEVQEAAPTSPEERAESEARAVEPAASGANAPLNAVVRDGAAPAQSPRSSGLAVRQGATMPQVEIIPLRRRRRGLLRFVLMVLIPLGVAGAGLYYWLQGGRYVSTDNAYVGADKVMITPSVPGRVASI